MEFLGTPAEASAWCDARRADAHSIGYVPTMGALHDGHLALVRQSMADNDLTCVSIFINPLQFNNPDDLDKYPRDMAADLGLLEKTGTAMVYTGSLETFFPDNSDPMALATGQPCKAIAGLEAHYRPGHLEGVQAIVERLFATVGPCRAYFGEKDFQQTLVIREIAARHGAIEVVVCPTVREHSGLAMSSRNTQLSADARQSASRLYQALLAADQAWRRGERSPVTLQGLLHKALHSDAIEVQYATVRDPRNWSAELPAKLDQDAQALIAATVGGVRLIDNIRLG